MRNPNQLKNSQEFKFAIIGGFNTLLDFIILFGLTAIGFNSIIANIFSTGITFVSSFILNKQVTFKSQKRTKRELIREMILFTIVTLFGLWVIQSVVIYLASGLLGNFISQENIVLFLAKVIATGFSLIWNFVLYKRIVFTNK
ncbi:MAG: GtrA family protein [Candidatus Sacchiramonaceae bacterium]|nr:GtrA family protein [Candidatus Saccharimonadaceae bacterium]